jgi:hypothetical protein
MSVLWCFGFCYALTSLWWQQSELIITENPEEEMVVTAQIIRLERRAPHPHGAFQLTASLRLWKKKVWAYTAETLVAKNLKNLRISRNSQKLSVIKSTLND